MKILTVDDDYAPFAINPENGSSPIPVVPRDAGAATGVKLNGVAVDETLAPIALDTAATVTLATVNLTSTGNAFKITYTGILSIALGTGAAPDATFNVTIDAGGVPELDGEVGYTSPGAPATFQTTFGRTFWITGQTPGAHTIVLTADLSGTGTGATVRDGLQLAVEDWTL